MRTSSTALGVPLHSPAFLFERTTRAETGDIVEFVWFSPSKGRTQTTPNKAAPVVNGIDDWMLLSEPPPES